MTGTVREIAVRCKGYFGLLEESFRGECCVSVSNKSFAAAGAGMELNKTKSRARTIFP